MHIDYQRGNTTLNTLYIVTGCMLDILNFYGLDIVLMNFITCQLENKITDSYTLFLLVSELIMLVGVFLLLV